MTLLRSKLLAAACAVLVLGAAAWLVPACSDRRDEPFQIFLLGGSTAAGVPYGPRLDLALLTAFILEDQVAGAPVRVVNLARSGTNSSDAVAQAEQAVALARPARALIVPYLGDNEFLRLDFAPLEARFEAATYEEPICSAEERESILQRYESNLRAIAALAAAHGVPLVLCTVAVNLRDWDPNRSVLADPANRAAVEGALARAAQAHARGERSEEERELRLLLELEPTHAWGWYRLGHSLLAQGRLAEAREAFQARVDSDGFPTATLSRQNQAIRRLAAELRLPLLDAERSIGDAAELGSPGFDLFWDNCHPNLEGLVEIATGLAGIVLRELDPGRQASRPGPAELAELAERFELDGEYLRSVAIRRAQYCYVNSLLTWNREHRLGRSRELLEGVLRDSPGDIHALCSRAVLWLVEGDLARSRQDWQRAMGLNPRVAGERIRNPMVQALARQRGLADSTKLLE